MEWKLDKECVCACVRVRVRACVRVRVDVEAMETNLHAGKMFTALK